MVWTVGRVLRSDTGLMRLQRCRAARRPAGGGRFGGAAQARAPLQSQPGTRIQLRRHQLRVGAVRREQLRRRPLLDNRTAIHDHNPGRLAHS